ncbi:YceI family protein [Solimonas terrae]|uniref:YceI family protein n=1 Tax=Solimonas terrae TaxID=1396819 RepID=A0A6M2BW32_9GAMM|nr:YceI family protein [Solimonas terrae]NGY06475.1 YceI family protein [Solimonas terrae]
MKFLARLVSLVLLLGAGAAQSAPRALIAANSHIDFSVKEMGVSVSGRFGHFDASIDLDPAKPEIAHAAITVDVASLSTGDRDADAIAVDKPWLAKLEFPKASFTSSAIKALGDNRYEVKGALTIRGKTHDITLPLTTSPQADGGLVASGSFTIRRSDYAIGGGEWNEGGVVADEVAVSFVLALGPAT